MQSEQTVSKIIMPNKPHLDQVAACYLLIRFGKDKFPGIEKANVYFWDISSDPSKEDLDQWQKENAVLIDTASSIFDHHKHGKFAALLVAEFLDIQTAPELQALLTYIKEDDEHGLHNKFGDLAHIIKQMHKQGLSNIEVFNFAFAALNVLVYHDTESQKEFLEKAKVVRIRRGKNKIKLAIIESDNVNVSKYAMQNERIAAVIQRRKSGHTMIFTNHFHKLDLRDTIAAIRRAELKTVSKEPVNAGQLTKEGKYPDVEHWYYHKSLNAILNGSESLSNTKPTPLPLAKIVSIVGFSLSSDYPECCEDCIRHECQYYEYDFYKCYQKQKNTEKPRKSG